jgi:hypothetical protein
MDFWEGSSYKEANQAATKGWQLTKNCLEKVFYLVQVAILEILDAAT